MPLRKVLGKCIGAFIKIVILSSQNNIVYHKILSENLNFRFVFFNL